MFILRLGTYFLVILLFCLGALTHASSLEEIEKLPLPFELVQSGRVIPLVLDSGSGRAVGIAVENLRTDICRVAGLQQDNGSRAEGGTNGRRVLVGKVGGGGEIDRLAAQKSIDVSSIAGASESFVIQVIRDSSGKNGGRSLWQEATTEEPCTESMKSRAYWACLLGIGGVTRRWSTLAFLVFASAG